MFTLTIATRDYIPFTLSANATDLVTAALVMQAGLQVRQSIALTISGPRGTATISELKNASQLCEAVTELIEFVSPR